MPISSHASVSRNKRKKEKRKIVYSAHAQSYSQTAKRRSFMRFSRRRGSATLNRDREYPNLRSPTGSVGSLISPRSERDPSDKSPVRLTFTRFTLDGASSLKKLITAVRYVSRYVARIRFSGRIEELTGWRPIDGFQPPSLLLLPWGSGATDPEELTRRRLSFRTDWFCSSADRPH